jgi:hypothetical protein
VQRLTDLLQVRNVKFVGPLTVINDTFLQWRTQDFFSGGFTPGICFVVVGGGGWLHQEFVFLLWGGAYTRKFFRGVLHQDFFFLVGGGGLNQEFFRGFNKRSC